jgi:DNA-binding HxlR family transcriptional regulator
VRAGAFALSLLSVPLNVHALQALEQEPTALIDLRRTMGSPPQTTMRGHLRTLTEIGAIECVRRAEFPVTVDYALAAGGRELLGVSKVLQSWLEQSPEGPLRLGDPGAKSAVKALVGGWSSGIIRALAARPLSLTALSRLIAGLNYPSLERRLAAMRLAGQIEAVPGESRGTPYRATRWLRGAVAPLAAGSRWERNRAAANSAPIGRLDVEAAFLLTVPYLRLPAETSGACRMAVELQGGSASSGLAGVLTTVDAGRVVSCVSQLTGPADGWASGTPTAWMDAILENDIEALEIGGDGDLVRELTGGLRSGLLRVEQRT